MANSGTVTAGSAALASQYNNLRDDVLNVSTGHTHTGASEDGALVAATGVSSGTAALGAVLTADGSGAAAFLAAGAQGGILKYEEFTSSGSFVIPANASSSAILILNVVAAGAGGSSGERQSAILNGKGGSGGVGGGIGDFVLLASQMGTPGGTVTVTIGAGGAGGAAKTTTGNGNVGSPGGTTSFGALSFAGGKVASAFDAARSNHRLDADIFQVVADTSTTSGVAAGSAQPTSTRRMVIDNISGLRYSYAPIGLDANFKSAFDTAGIAAGGGSGGGVSVGTVAFRGGNGGKYYDSVSSILAGDDGEEPNYTFGNGTTGGTAPGDAGGSTGSGLLDGGGGGAGALSGVAGSGGNGAIGGGGGGGGASINADSGAGGAGGGGRVRVWVIG